MLAGREHGNEANVEELVKFFLIKRHTPPEQRVNGQWHVNGLLGFAGLLKTDCCCAIIARAQFPFPYFLFRDSSF